MQIQARRSQPPQSQPPQAQPTQVKVQTFWQDPWVGPSDEVQVDVGVVGSQLSNPRVEVQDTREVVRADAQGNYASTPGSDAEAQLNAQVVTSQTLSMWEKYREAPVSWSFWGGGPLTVVPHKKAGMNAYYSRWEGSTNYFYQPSQVLNTVVKTANSTDVVAHETGHAVLDGMKPGYLSTSDRETGAFHEAFGDCSAMLATLQDLERNQRILEQTGGDLSKPNAIAWLAEEFGKHRRLTNDDPGDDDRAWLRNAQNKFTYVKPETLGDGRGDDETLGGEIHSFARLFAGAFYDCLNSVYRQAVDVDVLPPAQALKSAADALGPMLARAVDRAPANRGKFKDIALGLIQADQDLHQGKFGDAFRQIFLDRKIITPEDLQAQENRLRSLPQVSVDHNFVSPEEATAFVQARAELLGLPEGLDLRTVSLTQDERGEQVVNLLYSQSVPVSVEGLEGLHTEVLGGLTLAFDARGRLSDVRFSPVDSQAVAEEMAGLAYLQRQNRILEAPRGPMVYTRDDGHTFQAVIRGDQLVKIPSSSCDCGHSHA